MMELEPNFWLQAASFIALIINAYFLARLNAAVSELKVYMHENFVSKDEHRKELANARNR